MMQGLINAHIGYAQQALEGKGADRHGTVTGYDPNTYSVKVKLQPDDVETGWLPLKSVWVGAGWGLFCPPSIGDAVEISYQEGNEGVGSVGLRFFNDVDRPLPVPSGEFWLVHQSGSSLKFNNDGLVTISSGAGVVVNANMTVNGSITATGDVTANGISLDNHSHGGVKSGGDSTGKPK